MLKAIKNNLSLVSIVAVILIASIGGYYLLQLKQEKYPASSFISLSYKWGVGDTLVNEYNSLSGKYQYLNNRDQLIKTNLKLNINSIIFLHSKANELEFWSLPNVIANSNAYLKSNKVLRYEIIFNYEQLSKKIIFLTDYDQNAEIANRASSLQKIIEQIIVENEKRYR
jgi:hypothetical protein